MLLEFIELIKSLDRDSWRSVIAEGCGNYRSKRFEPKYYCIIKSINDAGYDLESVDGYGGEDCGSDYWGVFKLTKGEQSVHFKISGYYASHYGTEFYDYYNLIEVEKRPVQTYEWVSV